MTAVSTKVQPILVCMTWRGGARFERCLASIAPNLHAFARVILSVTSAEDSPDMMAARAFRDRFPTVEVICTGQELPTMQHQAFWVDYLQRTGALPTDWIYWLAYDDEVRGTGIHNLLNETGSWPLREDTAYFGPWAMRHESAETLWSGDPAEVLESWTSFPVEGPRRLPVMTWIRDQVAQPTYIQMSGSITPFRNFLDVRDKRPRKTGPMRIEMAIAAAGDTKFVEELAEPVSIIYGRSNSDRAAYGNAAHREDVHLVAWLTRYIAQHPGSLPDFMRTLTTPAAQHLARLLRGSQLPVEEWRVRGSVSP